ncbi:hypothetical protein [Thermoanaerobacter wiegelii]|uniref:Uncharacterized protein n=1 Tax=Thermoanaerobacter wiegelii Rt8.B1 TaxID=697303 RepID=G2MRK8_9THEO|nr:hypothetical protein [Thermoanaerobacter wiegelii]AEM79739.1 hypothetical protein Thewi_2404 [Thermoanaerobacter wiegelii Rt8.B1]
MKVYELISTYNPEEILREILKEYGGDFPYFVFYTIDENFHF